MVCRCRLVTRLTVPARLPAPVEYPAVGAFDSAVPLDALLRSFDTAGVAWQRDGRVSGQIDVTTAAAWFVFVTDQNVAPPDGPVLAKAGSAAPAHACPPIPPGTPDDGYGA
ncbi:hypothetical protein ACIRBX_18940 [Kitasatospora sp. NPDC096147]|uniref:hypothetical protein n=1 Tax=Kitasatospora sp. NPDC096147 TaxID=3364093 RepID=UPI00381AD4BA